MRKPLQGLRNVVRFNWPYYAVAASLIILLAAVARWSDSRFELIAIILIALIALLTLISLVVTLYVYDLSGFYRFEWLDELKVRPVETMMNVNAGFDETSALLKSKFPNAKLVACDFYDPARHTEPSIARARRAYPPFEATVNIITTALPFGDASFDLISAIMSAHEIRDRGERKAFLTELRRAMTPTGRMVVVEHLRDSWNFISYNIGAFHFHSRSEWLNCFRVAGFAVEREKKLTPFITAFFLKKNGTES